MQRRIIGCRTKLSVLNVIVSSAMMLFFQLPVHADGSVRLAWNPAISTNIVGYRIYYGTVSRSYTNVVAIGNNTNVTISGLVQGRTYYFAATTVDTAGHQSGFSNEASNTVPVMTALAAAARSSGQFSFTVSGVAGQRYVVQASTNLLNWIPLQTNTLPFLFTDTNAVKFKQRYYRALYLPAGSASN